MSETFLQDPGFRDKLLALILKDRNFLRTCFPVLDKKDFNVNGKSTQNDKVKAELAKIGLSFYEKYNEPLGALAKTEVINFSKKNKLAESWRTEAVGIVKEIIHKKVKAPEYIIERIVEYKKEQAKKLAISELLDSQEAGELTDEKWKEVCDAALLPEISDKFKPVDYFKRLDTRINRRRLKTVNRFPMVLIEELDRKVRILARGQLGLILAPYKRGKSLMLMHIALSLVLQKYQVLYLTLEDPLDDVEDRLDAAVSFLPIKKLNKMPKALRERFAKFKRNIKRKLKLVDGTEGGMTVAKIQSIVDQERNKGFFPDAIIVDYDEELQAKRQNKERRFEFDEIYRDLRRLAARNQAIVWTASQSKRGTHASKIVTGDDVAEDVSKIKKASIVLSLGQGDWGENSLYVFVAAHKHDRQHVGVNIMSDLDRMRIYDSEKTAAARRAHPEMKRRD